MFEFMPTKTPMSVIPTIINGNPLNSILTIPCDCMYKIVSIFENRTAIELWSYHSLECSNFQQIFVQQPKSFKHHPIILSAVQNTSTQPEFIIINVGKYVRVYVCWWVVCSEQMQIDSTPPTQNISNYLVYSISMWKCVFYTHEHERGNFFFFFAIFKYHHSICVRFTRSILVPCAI